MSRIPNLSATIQTERPIIAAASITIVIAIIVVTTAGVALLHPNVSVAITAHTLRTTEQVPKAVAAATTRVIAKIRSTIAHCISYLLCI